MKKIILGLFICVFSMSVNAACTGQVKIKELWPREGGWVHVLAEGVGNMDLLACGANSTNGMLFNFNDTNGTPEGKKILYSILLAAFSSGKTMKLCSSGCDSQHPSYSRLSHIDNLQ